MEETLCESVPVLLFLTYVEEGEELGEGDEGEEDWRVRCPWIGG